MKRNIFKKLAALGIASVTALGLLAGCGKDTAGTASASDAGFRTVDEIKESGTINIGVFSDKSPFGYVDENGDYQGYDVYFAERIGNDLSTF